MPKFLSALTAVAAATTCTALVLAQDPAPPAEKPAVPPPTADEVPTGPKQPVFPSESAKPSKSTPKPSPKPTPAASPAPLPSAEAAPTPTPKPRKTSFFGWLFGSHRKQDEPVPTPNPTPTPLAHKGAHKPSSTPVIVAAHPTATPKLGKSTPIPKKPEKPVRGAKPEGQPEATPKPEKPTATPKPAATPKPEKAIPASKPENVSAAEPPTATPTGKKLKGKTAPKVNAANAPAEPTADADAETKEKYHFDVAKSKALQDPEIAALKTKADEATTEEESKKALRSYNKALFEKIRRIDSSVSEYSEHLEAAILKRLSE